MLSKLYLTIDDSPSIHTQKVVDLLLKNNIPAVFYARGEFIEKHQDKIIYAIQKGFLIGNHSYSHPFFSEISLKDCQSEIIKTENLIDDCYQKANVPRPKKIIRLPFGDRGAGGHAASPSNDSQRNKVNHLQDFLKSQGFEALPFSDLQDDFIDAFWDWDTKDYKKTYIQDPKSYLELLEDFYQQYPKETAILLLHDFDHNHHLFKLSLEFLLDKKIQFLDPRL